MVEKTFRGEALLDPVLTNAAEHIKEVKIRGGLGYSSHTLVEFMILRNTNLAKIKVRTPTFRRENFQLFKELVDGDPWKLPLGIEENNRAGHLS